MWMKKRFITIIKRYYSGPESWSCIHTWNRLQILLRKASLISASPASHSWVLCSVETNGGNSRSCQTPDALGPSPATSSQCLRRGTLWTGHITTLTLAGFQQHQLHLAWRMAATGSTAFPRLWELDLQPAHMVRPRLPVSPRTSTRALQFPSTLNPSENGHLSAVNRNDEMKTTRMKSHVTY